MSGTQSSHTEVKYGLLTKLARIAELARQEPRTQFTSLAHLLDAEFLKLCHAKLKKDRASGIDEVTKQAYEERLSENLESLVQRLKTKAYRPLPVKRVYIPKTGSDKKRPLGIPAYEDKIVQLALAEIISAIYEPVFIECSCGFRPNRSAHDALRLMTNILETKRVSYVVDADIRGFYEHVDHAWMMKFLEHRIIDPSFLHIICRVLRAGCMEDGAVQHTREGTPQGGNLSPVLSNIYLHYVLDLWFEKIVRRHCRGAAYMVRYADDFVCCFEQQTESKAFYQNLQNRLGKFNLTVAEEKSKIIEFGRFAITNIGRKTGGKPETFDFLGFTHYCGLSRRGKYRVKRKTCRAKYRAALIRIKEWIRQARTQPIEEIIVQLRNKMAGYFHYYGITDNSKRINSFGFAVKHIVFKWLNRRSQRKSFLLHEFYTQWKLWQIPEPKIHVNIYERRPHIGYVP